MKEQLEKDYADGKRVQSRIKDGEKIEGIDIKSYWRGSQTANYIARCYLEDLDEPEVLSQEFIDKYKVDYDNWMPAVPIVHLQNLLVPKQELPVIPKFVAEWIEETKPYKSLRVAFEYIAQRKRDNHDDKLAFWVEEGNSETFARAWLDGYEIEQEPKYYVDLDTAAYVAKWDGNGQVDIYTDGISGSDEFEFHLTEQEIKDYDERYWPFAVKVEGLEEC